MELGILINHATTLINSSFKNRIVPRNQMGLRMLAGSSSASAVEMIKNPGTERSQVKAAVEFLVAISIAEDKMFDSLPK